LAASAATLALLGANHQPAPASDPVAYSTTTDTTAPATPGDGGTIRTTFHHPFYDQTQSAFVEAQNLHVGNVLQTPTGTAQVSDLHLFHANTTTYDLTIGDLHTYYVEAGDTPVLVHNCTDLEGDEDAFPTSPTRSRSM
jgi:hypothetical protein